MNTADHNFNLSKAYQQVYHIFAHSTSVKNSVLIFV